MVLATLAFFLALLGSEPAAVAQSLVPEGFEDAGASLRWVASNGLWQIGAPGAPGPAAAHGGTSCLGTVLTGNYPDNVTSRVVGPAFTVPAANLSPRLRFWQWFNIAIDNGYGGADFGKVQITTDGGTTWQNLSGQITSNGGGVWTRSGYDLAMYAGQTVSLAFYFESHSPNAGSGSTGAGWYIDDVQVVTGALTMPSVEDFELPALAEDRWISSNGLWQIGAPGAPGPTAAHGGASCLGTVLTGNYPDNVTSRVVGPAFTVPAANLSPRLRFWQWFNIAINNGYGGADFGKVQITTDGGTTWQALSGPITSNGGGVWTRSGYDLAMYAGQTVSLAFYFESHSPNAGSGSTGAGWYVDDVQVVTGARTMPSVEDFELLSVAEDRWVSDNGLWQIGAPGAPGPAAAHGGTSCLGTVLTGNYPDNVTSRVVGPAFTVPAANLSPRLRFWQWFNIAINNGYGGADFGKVQITTDGGTTWQDLSGQITSNGGGVWTQSGYDLAMYAGQTVSLAFYFESHSPNAGSGSTGPGWYLDDVEILGGPLPPPTQPGIVVQQPSGTNLGNGSSTVDFGPVLTGTNVSKTFVINNTGTSNLTLGTLNIDGVNSADFTILTYPNSPLQPGTSTSFTVKFAPGGLFSRGAVLHIPSSDPNQAVFDINLAGTGSLPAFVVQASSTVVHVGDGTATVTVQRNFNQPATVDYQTAGDTAVAGLDFTYKQGTLSFALDELVKDITVPLLYRVGAPDPAFFTVQLSNPSFIPNSSVPTVIGIPGSEGIYILNDHPTDLSLSKLAATLPQAAPQATASITVTVSPSQAGGQWRLFGELGWRNSGTAATGLTSGNYQIEFKPVNGYLTPALQVIPLAAGGLGAASGTYVASGTPSVGTLQVSLTPANLGLGGWRLQGEQTYRANGATVQNLVTGNYIVEFAAVAGRVTPQSRVATINAGMSTNINATYLIDYPTPLGAGLPQLVTNANLTSSPYCFAGQIQTDNGFGSGFVPLDRIVVTAAHVLFDDASLSFAQGVRWFFQRETNAFDAPPQIPRGSYVLAGYASQRAADHSPDVSTGASRQLDAAVMYFLEPTARGGQSGYLASNSASNTWLRSPRNKFIAGYPVSGAGITPGLLYATPTVQAPFTFIAGSLFSTTALASYPGNSGGPLFVLADDGLTYYPAAIYLGGTNETVVRAIDSQVIDLMNRAETSGNGGANNTGGGVTLTSLGLSGTTAKTYGNIKTNLVNESGAVVPGARWTMSTDAVPRQSGNVKSGLAPATYTVSFSSVSGYITPSPASVSVPVAANTETLVTATYQSQQLPQTISFSPPATIPQAGPPLTLSATATSGLDVSFTWVSGSATLSGPLGATLTPTGTGIVVIRADQAGNANYAAAASVTANIQITNATPNTHLITLTASPMVGGATGGGGTFLDGTSVTALATPDPNYSFVSWTEGGNEVSASASYKFTVDANRTLVANFVRSTANAYLSVLVPGAGKLSPAFAKGTTSYTTTVPKSALYYAVTPTVAQAGATVTVNGTSVVSGSASGHIPLNLGSSNVITIIVTAPDGVSTSPQPYRITVTRASKAPILMDLTGSGKPDLIFQNTNSGQLHAWFLDGTGAPVDFGTRSGILSADYLYVGGLLGWQLAGIADVNGDGNPDLIFQNTFTGQVYAWFLDGTGATVNFATGSGIRSTGYLYDGNLAGWRLAGIADVNKDDIPDLIFQNTGSGQLYAWFLDGTGDPINFSPMTGVKNTASLYSGSLEGWRLAGIADVDHDDIPDLVFQNTATGQVYAWFLNGTGASINFSPITGIKSAGYLYGGGLLGWQLTGISDVNGDGFPDLVFQNTFTGQVYTWFLDGSGAPISFSPITGIKSTGYLYEGGLFGWLLH